MCLGLAACFEEDAGPGGGDLVGLATSGTAEDLQRALDAAAPETVRALRYGPAENGLAHAAVANTANPSAVRQVVSAGAEANLADANGRTPLHFAIELQAEAALLQLLAAGADPEIETGHSQTPRAFCEVALRDVPDYTICRVLLDQLP